MSSTKASIWKALLLTLLGVIGLPVWIWLVIRFSAYADGKAPTSSAEVWGAFAVMVGYLVLRAIALR